jgi:hypothetical protein
VRHRLRGGRLAGGSFASNRLEHFSILCTFLSLALQFCGQTRLFKPFLTAFVVSNQGRDAGSSDPE